jgi:HK97 family phage portal protein
LGFLERIQEDRHAEQRVIGGVPWRPWDSPYWKFSQGGPVHPTRAFYGTDKALGLPALYACARLLAESIASTPLKIYSRANGQAPPVRYYGPSLFDAPSSSANLYDWLYACMTSLVLHGNAWGMITGTDGYGYPTGIDWLPPDMVMVEDDPLQPWNQLRTRVYVYGRQIANWRQEMVHIRAFALPGRTEGISPLRAFALTMMQGMEAQQYGTDWFASGGFPPGTFQNTQLEIDAEAAAEIRESLTSSIRAKQPLVYGRDWDYKPVVVPAGEAQFIETMQMTATQLAAVYGLPPDRVGGARGDSLTYNTVEQSTLQVIEALRPWMVRLETAFFDLLPQSRYVRFNADALLKTDLKTRTEIEMQQRNMGLLTIDEIRDTEDRAPFPDAAGDEKLPLEVMVAMGRSVRAIPNSMLSGITLEMDLIVDRLEKLKAEGLTAPDMGSSAPDAETYLSKQVGSGRGLEGVGIDDAMSVLRELVLERRRRDETGGGPAFVGPWIPTEQDLSRITVRGAGPSVPYDPAMYTAHRIDETTKHLAHATERLSAARTTRGDARAYEADHVLQDLDQAHAATQRLVRNVRENYPAESAELDRITAVTQPASRAAALSPGHKVATFSHLLQTVLYDQGHALRHTQAMRGEDPDDSMWDFDAEHAAKHTAGALEHIRKLGQHVTDNYPDEARWLTELHKLGGGQRHASLAGMNGNGRHH